MSDLYAGPGGPLGPVEIPLGPDDYARAYEQAALRMRNAARLGIDPASGGSTYFTPIEQATMGNLCEIGFARLRQVPWKPRLDDWESPDVDGYEVKGSTWRRASHMDGVDGGRIFVKDRSRAAIVVIVSAFVVTCRERVFYDGWIRTSEVRRLGKRSTWKGKYEIPYTSLHWARSEPLPEI